MNFYLKDEHEKILATFEYFTEEKDCSECKSIEVKKGSFMSKSSYCIDKWCDCKNIEVDRLQAVKDAKVEDYNDEYYILLEDLMFNSPYKAVSIMMGHAESGCWDLLINDNGQTLREVYRK